MVCDNKQISLGNGSLQRIVKKNVSVDSASQIVDHS